MTSRGAQLGRLLLAATLGIAPAAMAQEIRQPEAPPVETETPPRPPTLDKVPVLKELVQAPYPAEALAARVAGEVLLAVDVNETGAVTRVEVVKGAGYGFDEAATEAARKFVFEPGEAGGKPVAVRITYRYRFELAEPEPPAVATTEIRGTIRERGTRAPVVGVTVRVVGTDLSALTDAEGRFALTSVPVGNPKLRIDAAEYYPSETTEKLEQGKFTEVVYYLARRNYDPYESIVTARRIRKEVTQQRLDAQEVARIPGTAGDTLKVVQNLPGVARPAFGGGEIPVWGSAPGDTGIFIEDVRIPRLYHFGGLRSVVASTLVSSIDFTPGAYGARYGRGLGGIIEVETRAPKSDRLHGEASVDLLDAQLVLEGPLSENTSVLVSGRRSYVDAILANAAPDDLDFQTAPRYYDYQALVQHKSGRSTYSVFAFGSDDALALLADDADPDARASVDFRDYFHRLVGGWRYRLGPESRLSATVSVGYSKIGVNAAIGRSDAFVFDLDILPYTARLELERPLTKAVDLRTGVDLEGLRGIIDVIGNGPPREDIEGADQDQLTSDSGTFDFVNAAVYAELPIKLLRERLRIVPGLRIEFYTASAYQGTPDAVTRVDPLLEPRLGARYRLTDRWTLKAGVGLYHQQPEGVNYSRSFGDPDVEIPSGTQTTAGVEVQVQEKVRLESEVFYKDLWRLVVASDEDTGPRVENEGVGRAYGGQLLVRVDPTGRFFGWLAYTLMRSERRDHVGEDYRPFQYDQTHILTTVGSWHLPRNWDVGFRFRLTSGLTYTPVVDSYFDAGDGGYRPVYSGDQNSARLPTFHQLDIRVEKTFVFDSWLLSAYLEVINTYNRPNPETVIYNFDYSEKKYITGLPIFPVLGVRGKF